LAEATSTYRGIQFSDSDVVNKDDFIPAGEHNPHNVRAFLLHHEGLVVAVVFAGSLQDALDEAVDNDRLDQYMLDPKQPETQDGYMHEVEPGKGMLLPRDGKEVRMDWDDGVTFLGNASEPFDISELSHVELPNPIFSFCSLFNNSRELRILAGKE
jgi:hypothetical protein